MSRDGELDQFEHDVLNGSYTTKTKGWRDVRDFSGKRGARQAGLNHCDPCVSENSRRQPLAHNSDRTTECISAVLHSLLEHSGFC